MKSKTISGHYDTKFSLAHNNRTLVSKNVDPTRIVNNCNPVMAGFPVTELYPDYKDLHQQWSEYRMLSDIYWGRLRKEQGELRRLIAAERQRHWQFRQAMDAIDDCGLAGLLFLPLIITLSILEAVDTNETLRQYKSDLDMLREESMFFRTVQSDLRSALRSRDLMQGTELLEVVDRVVGFCRELSGYIWGPPERFATEEEIYEKVFEDSFQAFQAKQRKCRRYEGTYLDQIRERFTAAQKKCVGKADRLRVMAEAVEIVFTIGDKDNTGYVAVPEDAQKSEELLNDFCQHLLADGRVCVVTDRDLRNPYWSPPFKHGLIVLNLVAHYDEATPGVHLTVIPYTSGCKRGPDRQPSMGRAFAGMGYASEWVECRDEEGNPIPKLDREGKQIFNKDGSIRMKQEPKHQGIIDWIEDQKLWLSNEMYNRYGWEREYKGSHPRGNLSVLDYKVARAQERLDELQVKMRTAIQCYIEYANHLTEQVTTSLSDVLDKSAVDTITSYLATCPQERFDALFEEACKYANLAHEEAKKKLKTSLMDQIAAASARTKPAKEYEERNREFKQER